MSQNDYNQKPQPPLPPGQKQREHHQGQEKSGLNPSQHDTQTDADFKRLTQKEQNVSTENFTHTQPGYMDTAQDAYLSTTGSMKKAPPEHTTRDDTNIGNIYAKRKKLSLPDLIALVKDTQKNVRERAAAVRLLAQFGEQVPNGILTQAVTDSAKVVRIAALETYAELSYRFPAALVVAAFVDDEWSVRATAAWALGFFTRDTQAPLLRAIAEDSSEHSLVRAAAIQALGELKDQRSIELLIAILSDPPVKVPDIIPAIEEQDIHWHEREAAARTLGTIAHKDSTRALTKALEEDPSVYVRVAAIHALAKLDDLPSNTKTALGHAAYSSDKWLQETAREIMLERQIRIPSPPRRHNPKELDTN